MSTASPIPSSSSYSSQTRNPLSTRLYKILGTNFGDEATKEALQTLSELYTTHPTLTKGKQAERRADAWEDDDGEAHNADSSSHLAEAVPGESAARARRNLRRDMENKLAEGSRQFLEALGEVDQKLNSLQEYINAMHASCDEAETHLKLSNEASKSLLEHAHNLREERAQVEHKKSIVTLFLARFTLEEEEVKVLTSRDVPVGKRFFQVMDKTERIRTDCRVLMSGGDGPTKAGLDIMASTSTYLEEAYEKILRWCTYEFQQIGKDMQLEVSPTMRQAVQRLRKRPELLNEALGQLSQTRQTTLLSSFLAALTRGGPSGLPRPIELHAHDPMRYVGDMLAWVHQAIAAEREFLESLFEMKGDNRMVGSVRVFSEENEEEEWVRELMDLAVTKLCVPLKVRVQQTVRSQESSIMSYKIANLLQFYLLTMRRTIGDAALLSKAIQELTDVAYKVFYDAIETQTRALHETNLELDDASLTPPIPILDHAQILREIMSVYTSSLLGDEPEEERVAGFGRILDITIDPAIDMCMNASKDKQHLRQNWDRAVFVLNCLAYLQSVLEPHSFTIKKQERLQEVINEQVVSLTDEHYHNLLSDAGLKQVVDACTENGSKDPPEPLSHLAATEPHALQKALQLFSLWLSGLEVVQSPRLSQLTVQRLHAQIHQAALGRLAAAYQTLCQEVRKPANKYEAAMTLLGSERPFGQVNLLKQIFGIDAADSSA
ncbi:hypothetical protein HGRIS_012614 [Hohenbuehelia grisea]|uniref:Conserved oligomeric Golgi complex subunit 6 n=1 Tax=Hohenbuehelia grisea TaxID=104357 RepID=A0ABR3IST9_9AGAR